jgi:Flp pilus assembly protein TadB
MSDNGNWHEERDKRGHAMVPATPSDVVHLRVGTFLLVFLFAFTVLGLLTGAWVLACVAVLLGIGTIVDMVLAVRRQKRRSDGEAG